MHTRHFILNGYERYLNSCFIIYVYLYLPPNWQSLISCADQV